MKNKNSKRALLTSVLSLAVCGSMLVGTTFAWFTDSVSSTNNVITTGNLDAVLEYGVLKADAEVEPEGSSYAGFYTSEDYDWVAVEEDTNIFAGVLWEPGYVKQVPLRVSNAGSLAFKYQLSTNIVNETIGKTADGADIKLSDYLQSAFAKGVVDVGSRVAAWVYIDNPNDLGAVAGGVGELLVEGNLNKKDDFMYYNWIVGMPETVGNEANHSGKEGEIPSVQLGLNLVATQYTYEEDSFGNDYDEDATYPPLPETVKVEGNDKAAVLAAIEAANEGDIVKLTEDTTIAGYNATNKLTIEKAITLDLGGKTITTECGWGGIDAKGGCSIVNGTINHTGNTAAIKAFQVESIENVTINVTETAGKTKGGIVVQEGAGCYVGSIKNVTITGATNGIETYRCGQRDDLAIGSLENVTIDATDTGMLLSAPVGTATNCTINGKNVGIDMYLYGPYSVSINLVNCTVSGATAIYAHDEVGKTNPGSLILTYDAATKINGVVTQEFEEEVADRVTINN